ncbi:MAG: hypothetical protein ACHP6H_01580, partial [Legionellales bacterium]
MMRCDIKIKRILGLLVLLPGILWASKKPMSMSLDEAILLSLRFSPVVKAAEIQRVVDKFNLSVARNQFEFQYALTGLANQTNTVAGGNPLNIDGNYNTSATVTKETAYGTQYNLTMTNPVTVTRSPGFQPQTLYYNPALTLQVV